MGDVIHTLPAAAALRQVFPQAILGWLIEERWAELLCTLPAPRSGVRSRQRPLVDRIHTVDTKQWRRAPVSLGTWERMAASVSDLRTARYDVALDLQGAVRSALLAKWSGARVVLGSAQPRENLASMFYTRQVLPSGAHIVERNVSLAEAMAQRPLAIARAELPHDPAAEQEIDRWLNLHGIQSFALLNPGAGWGAKRWPAERYGDVAQALAQDGLTPVINSGPGEKSLACAVEAASRGLSLVFSGSLSCLIALTRRAGLCVGGDTGTVHLAAALGIPVVAIFGPTEPVRNGPFGTRSIVLRSPLSSTSYRHVAQGDQGLLVITADEVVAAARRLLKECDA